MRNSIFGWSLPPGVSNRIIDEAYGVEGPCEMCGGDPESHIKANQCICPECPECGGFGDPSCYGQGHLPYNMAQYMQLKELEQQWEEEARGEADGMYEDYKEAESILDEE